MNGQIIQIGRIIILCHNHYKILIYLALPNPSNFAISQVISDYQVSDTQYPINLKEIMLDLGITMDGVYRESVSPFWSI